MSDELKPCKSDSHPYEQRIIGDGDNWGEIMADAFDGLMASASESCTVEELDALKLKESARETYLLLKRTWPKVKASIGDKYDAAKKSVAEGLEAAKKKAGEYYDRAKEKAAELAEETSPKPNGDVAPATPAESAKE